MNKTEQIEKLFREYMSDEDCNSLILLREAINSIFDDMYEEEFVKWCIDNVVNDYKSGYLCVEKEHDTLNSIAELYQFWQKEVKK